jgi:hypothetical protein
MRILYENGAPPGFTTSRCNSQKHREITKTSADPAGAQDQQTASELAPDASLAGWRVNPGQLDPDRSTRRLHLQAFFLSRNNVEFHRKRIGLMRHGMAEGVFQQHLVEVRHRLNFFVPREITANLVSLDVVVKDTISVDHIEEVPSATDQRMQLLGSLFDILGPKSIIDVLDYIPTDN